MIRNQITDGSGSKKAAYVRDDALLVSHIGYPAFLKQKTKIFSQMFTDTGLASGSNDLGIDGSVTPSIFCIPADNDNDRYISRITFILGYGTSAEMYEFADSGAALINGVKLAYSDKQGNEIPVMNPKSNLSFMRSSGLQVTNTNWETRGFAARGDFGLFVNIDLAQMMPPYGIKLDTGTKEQFCITIRDDCSDADLFNCQAFGFDRFE